MKEHTRASRVIRIAEGNTTVLTTEGITIMDGYEGPGGASFYKAIPEDLQVTLNAFLVKYMKKSKDVRKALNQVTDKYSDEVYLGINAVVFPVYMSFGEWRMGASASMPDAMAAEFFQKLCTALVMIKAKG